MQLIPLHNQIRDEIFQNRDPSPMLGQYHFDVCKWNAARRQSGSREPDRWPFNFRLQKVSFDFTALLEKLLSTMTEMGIGTDAIRRAAKEISTAADDLSQPTGQQAAFPEKRAAVLAKIAGAVGMPAVGTKRTRDIVSSAKQNAELRSQVVRNAVWARAMREI